MSSFGLPYFYEATKHAEDTNTLPENLWVYMCARCGKISSKKELDDDNEIWNLLVNAKLPIGTWCLCGKCCSHFLKFKEPIKDCEDLITCANYIERAILCRKRFLKTQVKSKQQDSLEQCLSMRQKECLTETWT